MRSLPFLSSLVPALVPLTIHPTGEETALQRPRCLATGVVRALVVEKPFSKPSHNTFHYPNPDKYCPNGTESVCEEASDWACGSVSSLCYSFRIAHVS